MPFVMDKNKSKNGDSVSEISQDISDLPFVKIRIINIK